MQDHRGCRWERADGLLHADPRWPHIAAALTRAADHLDTHGIHHEPVTRQPPLALLADLELPGPDPASVDIAALNRAIRRPRATLTAAAERLGTTLPNLARWARTHHIPLRARGGASHDSALRAAGRARRAPAVLRAALTSPYAWQRLVRFADAATYPTLQQAAEHLGINQPTLITQINRLEHDLGQPLLERADDSDASRRAGCRDVRNARRVRESRWGMLGLVAATDDEARGVRAVDRAAARVAALCPITSFSGPAQVCREPGSVANRPMDVPASSGR